MALESIFGLFALFMLVAQVATSAIAARRCRASNRIARSKSSAGRVSLIRTVCGIERFPDTLESGFLLDHANYELLFCVARGDDPVVPTIHALMDRYPQVKARLLIGDDRISTNPKLNNMVKGWRASTGVWVVFADSNIILPTDYIARIQTAWRADTGLVSAPPAGGAPTNWWSEIECALLNSHQARWQFSGPVRGTPHLVTKFSPDGTATRGTINNCAYGVTPWNTFMTAEENWAGYFRNGSRDGERPNLPREQSRYGVSTARGRYAWELAAGGADEFVRFDVTPKGQSAKEDYRNEANGFGWMVEIDPFNPQSTPVKRTHLGRFAHEGVVFAPAKAGKPVVCYSGDDSRFEYIYKFVSAKPYDAATANGSLLDEGTLYVAKFNPDGSGEWLALAPGKSGLTPENGFANLADILINTRLAADKAGATKMDRPEWGSIDPNTGEVYFTLTNNTSRTEAQVDPMNPRAVNAFGQIIRWREAGDDHAATSFKWELFVLAGNVQTSRTFNKRALTADNIFACPDGLWFDPAGRLWIQTDMGEGEMYRGVLEPMGSNQMLCADPRTGEIRRFLTGPIGQEITGVIGTPDMKTLFVGVQHPGATTLAKEFAEGKYRSSWPDGNGAMPRSATLVISRIDGGVVGT